MKILKITKAYLAIFTMLAFVFTACEKEEETSFTENRPTIIKIKDAENAINVFARDIVPTIETFTLIDIRRDATNAADLNQSITVKVALDATLLDDYNAANGTSFVELPAGSYTLSEDLNNLTFAPGEFAKSISITVDKSQLDLSQQYALGLTIVDASGGAMISEGLRSAIYSIGVKNEYDGRYRLDGAFYHPTQSPGYDPFTIEVEMHTSGPNSVKIYIPDFAGYYAPGLFAGVLNAFGLQEPEFTIDPVTNAVTVQNAAPGAVTFYTMGPGYNSHYDPATKTIYARWGYNYSPGPVFNPAANREWTYVLTYLGPR